MTHDATYRIMTADDIEAGLRLTRAAGWNQLRRDWEMFLARSPEKCFVAETAEKVIGTAATIQYQGHFSWIGMVLVDPAERGRGIGKNLIRRALEALAGEACVRLDATPAGEPLYQKFDFREEFGIKRMELAVTSPYERSLARPIIEDDVAAISGLDFEAFGADRSFLLRWLWEGAPEYAWTIEGQTGIEAYILGRRGFSFDHLGPIVAPSVELAQLLVQACLSAVPQRRVIVDAKDEPEWLKSLSVLGFREQRPFVRMYRGEKARPVGSERQWAFLGPEFG